MALCPGARTWCVLRQKAFAPKRGCSAACAIMMRGEGEAKPRVRVWYVWRACLFVLCVVIIIIIGRRSSAAPLLKNGVDNVCK